MPEPLVLPPLPAFPTAIPPGGTQATLDQLRSDWFRLADLHAREAYRRTYDEREAACAAAHLEAAAAQREAAAAQRAMVAALALPTPLSTPRFPTEAELVRDMLACAGATLAAAQTAARAYRAAYRPATPFPTT